MGIASLRIAVGTGIRKALCAAVMAIAFRAPASEPPDTHLPAGQDPSFSGMPAAAATASAPPTAPAPAAPAASDPEAGPVDPAPVSGPAARAADSPAGSPADSVQTPDSAVAAPSDSIGRKLYTFISYPFLQLVILPVEKVLVPVVNLALYPTKPPLRYFLNENVVDRTINLISFGDKDRIMLYPTMNLAPGTGSSTGLTLRDQALFGRTTERAVAQGVLYVNGDWRFRTYATAADMWGTGFNSKFALSLLRMKNASFNLPGTPGFWYYGDTSLSLSASVSHLLFGEFAIRGQYVFRDNHFGASPTQNDSSRAAFLMGPDGLDLRSRGLDSDWRDHIVSLGIARDTRNNQNIVLTGSDFSAGWAYHLTEDHHDFHSWQGSLSNYFLLGKQKYEITREEERRSGGLSVKKMLKKMGLESLRKELFNRKVLATHLYAAQSFEVAGNRMPVYGLQTLGNDTPLRGYAGSRFRDYTVLAASAEYRFPVQRLVDGVIFDEYGVSGRSWDKIEYWDGLRNSWGFGIRVRRPDIYLFRLQLAFHGSHGIQLNMSVDEPF